MQVQNTSTYMQICTPKRGAYVYVCRFKIQAHTCRYAPYFRCISARICMYLVEYFKDTCTYAPDTAPMKNKYIHIHAHTCTYMNVCITYAQCICDMHVAVSRAYHCAYVHVLISHTYKIKQCISVLYVYVSMAHMHRQDHLRFFALRQGQHAWTSTLPQRVLPCPS